MVIPTSSYTPSRRARTIARPATPTLLLVVIGSSRPCGCRKVELASSLPPPSKYASTKLWMLPRIPTSELSADILQSNRLLTSTSARMNSPPSCGYTFATTRATYLLRRLALRRTEATHSPVKCPFRGSTAMLVSLALWSTNSLGCA